VRDSRGREPPLADFLAALEDGEIRAAEKRNGEWQANEWVKEGVLLNFSIRNISTYEYGDVTYSDVLPLADTDDLGRRDIYYVGVNNSNGTYDFIVDKNKSTFDQEIDDKYNESLLDNILSEDCIVLDCDYPVYVDPGNGQPYTTWAIWNTTVELNYRDDRMHYSRNLSVPANT